MRLSSKGTRIPPALERRVEHVLRAEIAEWERHRAEAAVFLGTRLRQLANEREKLLRACHADAIDVHTLQWNQAFSRKVLVSNGRSPAKRMRSRSRRSSVHTKLKLWS